MNKRELELRRQKFECEALAHLDDLMRTAIHIAHSRQDGEDIIQETYLRAWRYFDSFEPGTNCRAWLFRIMFNVIKGKRGKLSRLSETPLEDLIGIDDSSSNVVMFDPLRQIEGHEILEFTNQLSQEYRSVLWLVVVEEFSYRETAEILDVPIGTVMSRLHRARNELRKLLLTGKASGAGS